MAKLIPLPPELFEHLSKGERVVVKLALYRWDMQRAILRIRKELGLDGEYPPLPDLEGKELKKYAWRKAIGRKANHFFITYGINVLLWDTDHTGYFLLPVLSAFAKHNVILSPAFFCELYNEEALKALKKNVEKRWEWGWKCIGVDFDKLYSEKTKEEITEKQFELATEEFTKAKERYKNKEVSIDGLPCPFPEQHLYLSSKVKVSVQLNEVVVRLGNRATKKDLLATFPIIKKAQETIKGGKSRALKYDEETLDVLNEIATLERQLREEGLRLTDIEKKIDMHLHDKLAAERKGKTYSMGSMRQMINRARRLGF